MTPALHRTLSIFVLLLAVAVCEAQPKPLPKGGAANTGVQSVCQDAASTLSEIKAWYNANKNSKPDLPTPPATIQDCSECGTEGNHAPNDDKINAYLDQLGQPEAGYIKRLSALIGEIKQALGAPPNTGMIPASMSNCAANVNLDNILALMQNLMKHIFDAKVLPSYNKFHGNKDYTDALGSMLVYYSREYANLVGYKEGNVSGDLGTESLNDENYLKLQQVEEDYHQLMGDYYAYFLDQLYGKFHYNLYPSLMWEARRYLMNGFKDASLENDVYGFINRGISFMHFKLKIEFEETSPVCHYKMEGETKVRCRMSLDTSKTCYLFEGMEPKGLTMKMDDITYTIPGASADYTGPRQADNPFIIRVNLCDGSPTLHLIFLKFGITGQMTVHSPNGDVVADAALHPTGYFTPDLAAAEKRLSDQQALADDFKSNKEKYKAAMMEWASHRGDANFPTTPAGKKDWALILQFEHETGMQTHMLDGVSGPAPAASSTGNNKLFTFDIPLQFSKQAISYTNTALFGNIHYNVKVTLEQKQDPSDNISQPTPSTSTKK
jgi:hypothetical protein